MHNYGNLHSFFGTRFLKGLGERSLVQQFLIVASLLVFLAIGAVGFWVSNKIEQIIVDDVTQRAGTYIQTLVAPHLLTALTDEPLPEDSVQLLDQAIALDPAGLGISQIKVWNLTGLNIFDTDKARVGQQYEMSDQMLAATRGNISNGLFVLRADEGHFSDPSVELPIFEVYLPVVHPGTGEVISIAEFYQSADQILAKFNRARQESWAIAGMVSLVLITGLYHIVARGSRIIENQRRALDAQVHELSDLLSNNTQLQITAQLATQRFAKDQETQMRRIGTELHDGVGQLISIVMLKLDTLFGQKNLCTAEYFSVKNLLSEAISELRLTAADLALPEIEPLTMRDAVAHIVSRHQRRTGTSVELRQIGGNGAHCSHMKLCVCRFVQEALTNAYKHANGQGQAVTTRFGPDGTSIEVSDTGPGFLAEMDRTGRPKLGLAGLRNRLESLGGTMKIEDRKGGGTVVSAKLRINRTEKC